MNLEVAPLPNRSKDVHVARDERALRDDADVERFATSEALEHPAGDPEASLGGLVRVGGGADHDRGALRSACVRPEVAAQIGLQRVEHALLDEDAALERFPPVFSAELAELGV